MNAPTIFCPKKRRGRSCACPLLGAHNGRPYHTQFQIERPNEFSPTNLTLTFQKENCTFYAMIGETISHYKIVEKIGEGGMGVVYKAEDTKLDRIVALKFLPQYLTTTHTERARFLQEAKAAAALNHPNVCVIHEIQDSADEPFIVMEYVGGQTIRDVVGARHAVPLPIDDALKYAIQIAEALEEAHNNGIVHRDIKSENIMLNAKNQIKVMDFGLAKLKGSLKLTQSSSTVGTLSYMAPEQPDCFPTRIQCSCYPV